MKTKYLLIPIIALLPGACSDEPEAPIAEPTISTVDSLAVIDIFHEANLRQSKSTGKDWNLADWHTWNGVTLELIDGEYHVTALDLSAYDTSINRISPEVKNLKYLRSFDYEGGLYMVGECPEFDCPLETLSVRTLWQGRGESLVRNILGSIGRVTETLQVVNISGSQETLPADDDFPLFRCPNLKRVRLNYCNLSGEVPVQTGKTDCVFDLEYNKFTSIDWELFRLRLTVPLVGGNPLTIEVEVPEDVAASEWWRLYGWRVTGRR